MGRIYDEFEKLSSFSLQAFVDLGSELLGADLLAYSDAISEQLLTTDGKRMWKHMKASIQLALSDRELSSKADRTLHLTHQRIDMSQVEALAAHALLFLLKHSNGLDGQPRSYILDARDRSRAQQTIPPHWMTSINVASMLRYYVYITAPFSTPNNYMYVPHDKGAPNRLTMMSVTPVPEILVCPTFHHKKMIQSSRDMTMKFHVPT